MGRIIIRIVVKHEKEYVVRRDESRNFRNTLYTSIILQIPYHAWTGGGRFKTSKIT